MNFWDYYSWMAMLSFPISHLLQLKKIIDEKHAEDVSYLTFATMIIGNISSFIYTNKIYDVRSWFNFIVPSIIEFIIILIIFEKKSKPKETHLFVASFIIIVCVAIYYFTHASSYLKDIAGLTPAFLFPMSVIFTLLKLYTAKTKKQANSIISWYLMVFGMLGAYILSEKYYHWQSICAFLLPAILSTFVIYKLYTNKEYHINSGVDQETYETRES